VYFRTISHIQHHHTTRTTPDPTNMAHVRPLRVLTLALSALATPLLIGVTVVSFDQFRYRYYWHSSRQVTTWCFGFIPLALTAAASVISLIHYRKYGRMPNFKYTLIDLFAFVWYLALLIPIWATEIGKLNQPGWGLLAGYTTAPMIVNMFAHLYIFAGNAKFVWSWIISKTEHECPNCRSKFTASASAPQTQETSRGGERYSLLRGEDYLDEDAVAYREARDSEEAVGVQGGADAEVEEDKGKGAIKL